MNERRIMIVLAIFASTFLWAPLTEAADAQADVTPLLKVKYRQHHARLRAQPLLPVTIDAVQAGGRLRGDVYATLDYPYAQVVDTLRRGSNWCEIAPLHLNVKACTHEARHGATRLTFYSGRKHFQPPEATRPFIYEFRVQAHSPDYFRAVLTPDSVTRDTEQNHILVEAIPLGRGQVFLHVQYSFKYSLWLRLAAGSYFATFGAHKSGFTVTGTDRHGRSVHTGGITGAAERNAVRYYLALQTYFSTRDIPEPDRHERRLDRWFDLTEQYAAQLHEISKAEYLSAKRLERAQQLRLQRRLDTSAGHP
ncbi:MAG: hypothetical protein A2140_01855 [Candidatus Muproteobacteria bacterium RBG_16_62_13]|uniref:Uncharacterized protein n=1 Tax=Candidatus Muproteobacteria bacterium RBG_16_62_13 TaxID=1817756 RepID=A0A1F6SX43_9PROT|nr:MAG: hypothetical protein A2140_01855 [Candidatus Muproteobacteria bacterium RBG_16_62_13]